MCVCVCVCVCVCACVICFLVISLLLFLTCLYTVHVWRYKKSWKIHLVITLLKMLCLVYRSEFSDPSEKKKSNRPTDSCCPCTGFSESPELCPCTSLSDSLDVQVLLSLTHLIAMYFSLWLTWCPCTSLTHLSWYPCTTSFSYSPELMFIYFFLLLTWADVHILLSLIHLSWCPCTSFSDSPELMSIYFFLWLTWVDVHVLLSLTHLSWCPYTSLTHLSWCPCTFLSDSPELMSMYFFVWLTWAGVTPACSGWSWPPPSAAQHCGYAPWQPGSHAHGSASAAAHRSVDQFITMSFMHYLAVCPPAAKDTVGFRQWRQK